MEIAVRPEVLFLSFSTRGLQNYSLTLSDIPKHFILNQIHEAHVALETLRTSHPRAVIITDEGIAKEENREVLKQVAKYVKDGGLAIVAGYWFANNVSFDYSGDPKPFFGAFDLPWEAGFGHKYSLWKLNEDCSIPAGAEISGMPDHFGMTAMTLKNVSPNERIYVPHGQARLEFPADDTEAAVAGTHVGNGYFVYIGDLNWEFGSELILLGFMGLRKS
jgi:hypothetical protein